MVASMTAEELMMQLGTAGEPFLLDAGDQEEFTPWSIPGVVNVPLRELASRIGERSVAFLIRKGALLLGDLFFVDGIGRSDLAERSDGFARNLYRSSTERTFPLRKCTWCCQRTTALAQSCALARWSVLRSLSFKARRGARF